MAGAALLLSGTVVAAEVALPLRADDLKPGERYRTVVHTAGIQALGKDINGMRHLDDDHWSFMTAAYDAAPGAKRNVDFVIYGKPFHAMADGVVIGCWRNAPENTPGSLHAWRTQKLIPGGGNHLWIKQDDGNTALYAHAVTGSIDAAICPNGKERYDGPSAGSGGKSPDIDPNAVVPVDKQVRVRKGQLLGRVGNSGASSGGPHLHVHLEKGGKAMPMMLGRGLYAEPADGKLALGVKWQRLDGAAWPEKKILFWPPHSLGKSATWNGTATADFQRMFDHFVDSGYMADTLACREKDGRVLIDSTWVPAKGAWLAYYGLSPAGYLDKKAKAVADGFHETARYTCNTSQGALNAVVFRK